MRIALCLGGAACLFDDIAAYTGPFHGVVACNEAGILWPGKMDAWVSLHPIKWTRAGDDWRGQRRAKGHPDVPLYAHDLRHAPEGTIEIGYSFPGQEHSGSSGMFAAKVALCDLGFDKAILCGIPMSPMDHFHGATHWNTEPGAGASRLPNRYLKRWRDVPQDYRDRIRSMSGATREMFGAP